MYMNTSRMVLGSCCTLHGIGDDGHGRNPLGSINDTQIFYFSMHFTLRCCRCSAHHRWSVGRSPILSTFATSPEPTRLTISHRQQKSVLAVSTGLSMSSCKISADSGEAIPRIWAQFSVVVQRRALLQWRFECNIVCTLIFLRLPAQKQEPVCRDHKVTSAGRVCKPRLDVQGSGGL